MIHNWNFFLRFLITIGCFGVYFFLLTRKQLDELWLPEDGLGRLRKLIFAVIVLATLTFIPAIPYLYFLSTGHDYRMLRNVVTDVSGFNQIATTFLLVLIFTYKIKSKDD